MIDATARAAMFARVQRLLFAPHQEWPRIAQEPMAEQAIFRWWILPLAAIGPVFGAIGRLLFVDSGDLVGALGFAVVHYLQELAGVYISAFLIVLLAGRFGAVRDPIQALKVAAFSATAGWLSDAFLLFPNLSLLSLVGLYSLYLLYVGLPICMRVPRDRAVLYFLAVVAANFAAFFVMATLTALLLPGPAAILAG